MSEKTLFLTETHPRTGRSAVLEDDGLAGWLYLLADSGRIDRDAWVYNRIVPPEKPLRPTGGGPPPATREYADQEAVLDDPSSSRWTFAWSADGESVAVLCNGRAMAAILAGFSHGHSLLLRKKGPWGAPLTVELLRKVFGTYGQGPSEEA